jgi:hypothetical protein
VVNARGEHDFDHAFATIAQARSDALFVGGDPAFLSRRRYMMRVGGKSSATAVHQIILSKPIEFGILPRSGAAEYFQE